MTLPSNFFFPLQLYTPTKLHLTTPDSAPPIMMTMSIDRDNGNHALVSLSVEYVLLPHPNSEVRWKLVFCSKLERPLVELA